MGTRARSLLQDALIPISRRYLDDLFAEAPRRDFQVRFWNGSVWGDEQDPAFCFVLNRPEALAAILSAADELALAEAYLRDDFDVEGNMEAAFGVGEHLLNRSRRPSPKPYLVGALAGTPGDGDHRGASPAALEGTVHSRERDRAAISYHYDLSPDFYALWLDHRMVYSCAYFLTGNDNLDTAQEQKLDYICRKLRLQPGESLLDIGCGWGGLVMHAASHYGVNARGITVSVPQADAARKRVQAAGMNERCRIEVCDYRDVEGGPYDKIVSVGMFEHVGEALLPGYFARAWYLLRPGGVFLNHGIARNVNHRPQGPSFCEKYVFPDGELVPIHTTVRVAETCGFEVRDVENLREHYALTLRQWVNRLEANAGAVRRITNEKTFRVWRLYMAAAAYRFRTGTYNLYQTLLAKPQNGEAGVPLTRADWYAS